LPLITLQMFWEFEIVVMSGLGMFWKSDKIDGVVILKIESPCLEWLKL
jgi:hypothetical protein